jgi:hypothetical protein
MKRRNASIINSIYAISLAAAVYCTGDLIIQANKMNSINSQHKNVAEYIHITSFLDNYNMYTPEQLRREGLEEKLTAMRLRANNLESQVGFHQVYSDYNQHLNHLEVDFGVGIATGLIALMCFFVKDLKKREAEGR